MDINKTDAAIICAFTVLYILLCIFFYSESINILEKHISPDGYIEFPIVVFTMIYIALLMAIITPVLLLSELVRTRVVPKELVLIIYYYI